MNSCKSLNFHSGHLSRKAKRVDDCYLINVNRHLKRNISKMRDPYKVKKQFLEEDLKKPANTNQFLLTKYNENCKCSLSP